MKHTVAVAVEPVGPELIEGDTTCRTCGSTLVAAALIGLTVGDAVRLLGAAVCAVCATPCR